MADRANLKITNPPGGGSVIRNDQGTGAGAARDFINFDKAGVNKFKVDASGLPSFATTGFNKRVVVIPYGDIVADSDTISPFLWKANKACTVTNIYICANSTTADATVNKQTIVVKRSSDDGVVVTYVNTGNPGMTAGTWISMDAVTNAILAANVYLYATFTKTCAGLAIAGLTFQVEYTCL